MSKKKDGQAPDQLTKNSKALAHPLRVRILRALEEGLKSPNILAQELDEPLGNVSYHVKTLLEYDAVELVKTEPRRGAVEHFYRATGSLTPGGLTDRQRKLVLEAIDYSLENQNGELGLEARSELLGARKSLEKEMV